MGLQIQAHAQTFNKRFDLFGEFRSQSAWGVEVRADGSSLVVFNGSYIQDNLLYSSGLSTVVVNPDGAFSSGYRLHIPGISTYPGWANTSSPLAGGGYLIGGLVALPMDSSKATIYWLTETGDVSDYRQLDLPGPAWNGRGGIQCPDGGFVVVGEMVMNGEMSAFLVKTDAEGNVEWSQTYGSPGLYESLTSIVPAPWGGYYIGGQKELSPWSFHAWILRVDEDGNVLGDETYSIGPFGSGGAQLTLTPDGTVWVGSQEYVGPGDYLRRAAMYEVGPNGDVIWQHLYGPTTRSVLYAVHQVPGSTDLISAGFIDDMNSGGPSLGSLVRATATGDSIWMRSYAYHDSLVELGNAGFYDMQPTPDGGFIAVGFAESVWQQGPSGWEQVYSRDVWVVKTDSMGCLEPGCHLIMGMETQITNLRGALTVAPNPVAQGGNVKVAIALPEGFTVHGQLRITVTDAMGRMVHEQLIGEAGHRERSEAIPASLSTTQLPSGLYHLHVSDNTRWISGAKLVVE